MTLYLALIKPHPKKIDIPWEVIPNRDGGATSTFDEAVDVLSFAKLRNWKRIIIVTDFFHTRRALHAFGKVFAFGSNEQKRKRTTSPRNDHRLVGNRK